MIRINPNLLPLVNLILRYVNYLIKF